MITGIEVPLELAIVACAIFAGAGLWTGRVRNVRPPDQMAFMPPPLRSRFGASLADRRRRARAHEHTVLHARIEHSGNLAEWTPELRQQVLDRVADVMRAGLRRDDRLVQSGPDDLTITIRGADTRTALQVAQRLREALAQLPFPHLSGDARVSARLGLAGLRGPKLRNGSIPRSHGGRNAAGSKTGHGHIVDGCEMEEIILLPAPATPRAADAA